MVKLQLPKLAMRVRFPLLAPIWKALIFKAFFVSIFFVWLVKCKRAKPKPFVTTERENKSGKPKCSLFFCS